MVGPKVAPLCPVAPFSCSENHLESLNAVAGTPSPPESPTSRQTLSLVNFPHPTASVSFPEHPCYHLHLNRDSSGSPSCLEHLPFQSRQHHQNILRSKATLQLKASPCRTVMGTCFHLKLPISLGIKLKFYHFI